MKELYPMHGIITTVITPFHSGNNKEIDWPSFRREIQTCMDAGVAGFLVPCMASEMNQLTHEEIIQEVRETGCPGPYQGKLHRDPQYHRQ